MSVSRVCGQVGVDIGGAAVHGRAEIDRRRPRCVDAGSRRCPEIGRSPTLPSIRVEEDLQARPGAGRPVLGGRAAEFRNQRRRTPGPVRLLVARRTDRRFRRGRPGRCRRTAAGGRRCRSSHFRSPTPRCSRSARGWSASASRSRRGCPRGRTDRGPTWVRRSRTEPAGAVAGEEHPVAVRRERGNVVPRGRVDRRPQIHRRSPRVAQRGSLRDPDVVGADTTGPAGVEVEAQAVR